MNNLVPDEWAEHRQGDVADFSNGKAYKLTEWEKVGTPVIRLQNLTGSGKNYYYSNLKLPDRQYCESGDLLYMWSATFGPHIWKGPKAIYHYHIWKVTCNEKDLTKSFLYQLLGYKTAEWLNQSNGMGILHITKGGMEELKLILPPLPEQQKIAAILTSVDEVIEKTQAQIDKLKDLKIAMMQELLTCGVGVDGKPHTEFKDSPVGRIPKGWACTLLDKMSKRGSGHTPDKQKPEYWNEGIKWVSLTDSSKLDNLYIHDTMKKISQLGIENSSASLHPEGTVVMVRDAGIGKSAIITSPMAVSQHLMAWVCNGNLDNYFLYYLLQLWKPKFEAIAMGSTIKTIGLPYFKKLQIPVPPIEEQKIISSALKSVDSKIFILRRKHSSLGDTKKALMQDLLTGKVRVTVPSSHKAFSLKASPHKAS
jgi:type I restriction enzyme S subunit